MMSRPLLLLAALLSVPALADDVPAAEDAAGLEDLPPEQYPLAALLDPLQADRLFKDADIGIQVVNADTGEEVYAHRADEAFVPASVMKTLTAAVALRTLGPAWKYTTAVLTHEDNTLDAEGTLTGNVHVWGSGDPTLVVEDMWRMARDLRTSGVHTIDGDLVFDGGYFDSEYLIDGWRKKDDLVNGPAYFTPISALTVNYNTVCIVVAPGAEAGDPARVLLETPTELVEITSEVTTGSASSRPWMTIEREVEWDKGTMSFTMEGSIPLDELEPWRYYRTMPNPSLHYADVFRSMLTSQGVKVKGRNLLGPAPTDDMRVLVRHNSDSLQNLLNAMNKSSSNIIAESVLKTVAAETRGTPGTTATGAEIIGEYLVELGVPADEFTLINGSGLSREIQLRPTHVNAVLLDMIHNEQYGAEFMASLSVGGQDGTLRRRFGDDEHTGRVRGKTGSVNGVYCLSGIILGGDGERYVFSFFVNGYRRSSRPVRRLQDRFGVAILDLPAQNEGE